FGLVARPRFDTAVHLTDDIRVRHTCVLEYELAILVETPAALVEHFSDPKARCVARDHEHRAAFTNTHVRIRSRIDEKQLRDAAVRNEELGAVEYPLVSPALGFQFPS